MTDEAERSATLRVAVDALFVERRWPCPSCSAGVQVHLASSRGYVEHGQSSTEACSRELREELGLGVQAQRLLVVDWAPHEHEGDELLFILDCGQLSVRLHDLMLDPSEIAAVAW